MEAPPEAKDGVPLATTSTMEGSVASVAEAEASADAITPSSSAKITQSGESTKLEYQFIRVPFEDLKKTIRSNHSCVEKEFSVVLAGVAEAADLPDEMLSKHDVVSQLTSLVSRLQGLKRKLEDGTKSEELQAQRCRTRLDHLEAAESDGQSDWNDTRLKRILVDYMLRMSYYNSASKLARLANIEDLVDIDVFLDAKKVVDSLESKEVAPALAWCSENSSRLRRSKSKLEFRLRLQEFIELVRVNNDMQAVLYARKYLAQWGATHMQELQHVFAAVAFKSNTPFHSYEFLFDARRWNFLIEQFKQEFCLLYGITVEPLLDIYLQAGLSALKTPFSFEEGCTKEDPLSQEGFRLLAAALPFSKQHHSKLVCSITKELMDTENPPLVLPNGYVYSTKALEEMAKANNGKVTCPRTGYVCDFGELVKAYIS